MNIENFNSHLQEVADIVFREFSYAEELLTKKQFVVVLKQMLQAGDFMKYICYNPPGQQIVYIPYRRVEELEGKIAEMETELERLRALDYTMFI